MVHLAKEAKSIQRSASAGAKSTDSSLASHLGQALESRGRPLDEATRSSMERGFGVGFGDVRVHDKQAASDAATALSARAFTFGNDVMFARGALQPESARGRALIAHELAHVVHQSGATPVSTRPRSGPSIRHAPGRLQTARLAPRIQRSTVEEDRLNPAATGGTRFVTGTPEGAIATAFVAAYRTSATAAAAEQVVANHADRLWTTARTTVRAKASSVDDRPLYWARLTISRAIRDERPSWTRTLSAPDLGQAQAGLLAELETRSRGQTNAVFSTAKGEKGKKRILVSGFDPFGLQNEIRRSNPSGAAVLGLDGRTLRSPSGTEALVEGVVFPVRFPDFDAGAVETFFRPFLTSARPPQIVATISQGSSDFELERYGGRRRSSGSYRDNLDVAAGVGVTNSAVSPGIGAGAEFIETTTSSAQRQALVGSGTASGFTVRVDQMVTTRSGSRVTGATAIARGARAGAGAGGGFLSNEIFYRVVRLAGSAPQKVPVIHLHTPALNYASGVSAAQRTAFRRRIVTGVEQILTRAIDTI